MYQTIYEIGLIPPSGFWACAVFAVFGIALMFGDRIGIRARRGFLIAGGILAILLAGTGMITIGWKHFVAYHAYQRNQVQVVEGPVHVIREARKPQRGADNLGEVVEVNGLRLELRDLADNPGYRTSIIDGGVLREGVRARIFVFRGWLLRVDIKRAG